MSADPSSISLVHYAPSDVRMKSLDQIMRQLIPDVIDLAERLVLMPTPSDDDEGLRRYNDVLVEEIVRVCAQVAKHMGIDDVLLPQPRIERIQMGPVDGEWREAVVFGFERLDGLKANGPTTVMVGHSDVVYSKEPDGRWRPPTFGRAEIDGQPWLFGEGLHDMKIGQAMIIFTAAVVRVMDPHAAASTECWFTPDEEIGSKFSRSHLFAKRVRSVLTAMVFEGPEARLGELGNRVTHQRHAPLQGLFEYEGRPWSSVAQEVMDIDAFRRRLADDDTEFGPGVEPVCTPTEMHFATQHLPILNECADAFVPIKTDSGSAFNAIPDYAKFTFLVRDEHLYEVESRSSAGLSSSELTALRIAQLLTPNDSPLTTAESPMATVAQMRAVGLDRDADVRREISLGNTNNGWTEVTIEYFGRSAHGGVSPDKGANTTIALAKDILLLDQRLGSSSARGTGLLRLDMRAPDEARKLHYLVTLGTLAKEACGLRRFSQPISWPSMPSSVTEGPMRLFAQVAHVLNHPPVIGAATRGGAEASLITELGVPNVIDGMGPHGTGDHGGKGEKINGRDSGESAGGGEEIGQRMTFAASLILATQNMVRGVPTPAAMPDLPPLVLQQTVGRNQTGKPAIS